MTVEPQGLVPSVQHLQKLAFVQYLYQLGVRQSRQSEHLRPAALLMFHDALELFLSVACSHRDARPKDERFAAYIHALEEKIGGLLPDRAGLDALNKARVGLKHYGNMPSGADLEGYRATTTAFLQSSAPLLFGVDLDAISMADLVSNDGARNLVRNAAAHATRNAFAESVLALDAAFQAVVEDFDVRCSKRLGPSPYLFQGPLWHSFNLALYRDDQDTLTRAFDVLASAIRSTQGALRMLSSGVDMRKHRRFFALVERSRVFKTSVVESVGADDVAFCREFVIETALSLQEFVAELEAKP
jgi:hypothetical protein